MAKKKRGRRIATKRYRKSWLDSAEHLPLLMRDFHDQKDLFKAIHRWAYADGTKEPCSWADAHIYTVDMFLCYMAVHGYTLQRCRANVDFCDLGASLKADREERMEQFAALI